MLLIDLMELFVNVLCRPGIKCTVARHNPAKMLINANENY